MYLVTTLEVYHIKTLEVYRMKILEVYLVTTLEVYLVNTRGIECSLEVTKQSSCKLRKGLSQRKGGMTRSVSLSLLL